MKGENPVRIRLLELLADEKEPILPGVPRATVHYHINYLMKSGLLDKNGRLTPKGMLHYLRLLKEGVAVPPSKIGWRIGIWLNGLWAHIILITTFMSLYVLLNGKAIVIFHVIKGPFLISFISLLAYIGLTSAFSMLFTKGPIFPASYIGLFPVTLSTFLPLEGGYRIGYSVAQTVSILLCTETLHRATRIGRYKALVFNLALYGLGLMLYWRSLPA